MSELPYPLPTADLTWAYIGDKTEPSAGKKAAGFIDGDTIVHDELNWRWNAEKSWLDWLVANSIRTFDSLYAAVAAAMTDGDLFKLLRTPESWLSAVATQTPLAATTTIRNLCIDGGYIYYWQNNKLVKANAVTGDGGAAEIATTSALGSTIADMHTDGDIIAVGSVGSATDSMRIYETDGTLLEDVQIATHSQVRHVWCDSDATERRVYYATNLDQYVYQWDSVGGLSTAADGGAGTIVTDVCATPSFLVVATAESSADWLTKKVKVFNKAGTLQYIPISVVATGTGGTTDNLCCSDGDWVWMMRGGIGSSASGQIAVHGSPISGRIDGSTTPIWSYTSPLSTDDASATYQNKIFCDHRYVYVQHANYLLALDKYTGGVVMRWAISDATTTKRANGIWSDGLNIWSNNLIGANNNYSITRWPTECATDGLWVKTSKSRSFRLPFPHLVTPI